MRAVGMLLFLFVFVAPVLGFQAISPDQNLDLLWEQVHAQPEDFSVACVPLNDRTRTVMHNANDRFPLASVSKLLIFIEYAQRVDAGIIAPDERVNVSELNRYALARTDRGAHDDFLDLYPPNTEELSLWNVAAVGMMQFSSNAASDYMLDRLAPINWDNLFETLYVNNSSTPHPLTMIPLLMNNHEAGQPQRRDVDSLSRDMGMLYFYSYINNDAWRQEEITYRTARRRQFPSWDIQSAILQQHTATGTVYDFLNVMLAVYSDNGALTDGTKQLVRAGLRWEGYENIDATYSEYGSKLGFYSGGTLTLVAYGAPYGGSPVISVTFLRNIPRERYYDMVRADSIGDFAHWMNLNTCGGLQDAIRAQV